MKKPLSLPRSLLWIFCSALLVNLAAYGGIKGYQYWKRVRNIDFNVPIRAIVQTGPQKEALKTSYIAELLTLSSDRAVLTSQFDLKRAEEHLLGSPVIKAVDIKLAEPGILYIDYTTRQPVALLGDYENMAIDQQGYPFPIFPFFTPKKLPEIYLGMDEEIAWNKPIQGEKIDLAFELLKLLTAPIVRDLYNVRRIDVSNAFASSYGKREIVLRTEDEIYLSLQEGSSRYLFPRLLRLSSRKYSQELSHYLKLREQLLEKENCELHCPSEGSNITHASTKVIDFRIDQLAFIEDLD
ncbi:MAG: Cell division protein FtsQ [Chlamydiae bacterium]|nr:Cell division protein FtsQ [Chlamydiota bacterium]